MFSVASRSINGSLFHCMQQRDAETIPPDIDFFLKSLVCSSAGNSPSERHLMLCDSIQHNAWDPTLLTYYIICIYLFKNKPILIR